LLGEVETVNKLHQAEEALRLERLEVSRLMNELLLCQRDLKTEQLLNKIALTFMPEDVKDDYYQACPSRQIDI
jgi:hypothetical protein